MRIIVLCGKGGVGKTTLAAAHGFQAARLGQRTLVFSIDPAHSLALALRTPLGPQPVQVAPKVWAAELEAIEEIDNRWSDTRDYLAGLLSSQGLDNRMGGEISSLPGINEFAALVRLKAFYDSGEFDTIILDNAPTGFALRLLSLPEIAGWYAKQARRLYERHGAQLLMLAPMMGANIPLPPSAVIGQTMGLLDQLKDLPLLFADPDITSTRLVMSPDALALEEAKNAYSYLCLYGLNADALIVNGLLPEQVRDPFFAERKIREAAIVEQAGELFAPMPIWKVPLQAHEVLGPEALDAFARALWGEADPGAAQSDERAITIRPDGDQLLVSLKLPFIERSGVDLAKFENELYITLGNHRRNLLLPPEASDMQPVKAKFSEGRLLVTLARPA